MCAGIANIIIKYGPIIKKKKKKATRPTLFENFMLLQYNNFLGGRSFEKLLQDICPFCILFIHFLHFLYQFTNLKFPHLSFGSQNPSYKWVFLRSSLIRFDKIQPWVIISLNVHYFVFALYNFHILTLIL